MSQEILRLENLHFTYPDGTAALAGINLSINQGQKIAFLGPNGAGKSTLFLHLNGIHRPTSGQVYFRGQAVDYKRATLLGLRRAVGVVFQDPDSQLFASTVFQEVSFGPMNLGWQPSRVEAQVETALTAMDLQQLKHKATHLLSYGQKKRVAIADVLAMEPEVIVFDEPTVWLDPRHKEEAMSYIDQLTTQGITVVLSTHDVDTAYSWADKIYVLNQGQIQAAGTPWEIFSQPELLVAAGLEQPLVLETYQHLKASGKLKADVVPRTKKELFALI